MVYYICICYKSITIYSGATPVVCAKDAAGVKYRMAEEFSVDTFRQFMVDLAAGDIEPYLKSGTNIFFLAVKTKWQPCYQKSQALDRPYSVTLKCETSMFQARKSSLLP